MSELSDWNVLLLEAGGDESISGQIPALAASLQMTNVDWNYATTVQDTGACKAFNNHRCRWPAGKMLGGSSSINYMLYVRGNRRDYDRWASMGNYGWSYDDVLPYFIKSEDNKNREYAATKYHGTGGYLTVGESAFRTPLADAFLSSGQELGYTVRDCNGEFQTGFMRAQGTVRKGQRCSTSKAFLRPARYRPNLHISTKSTVLKILIDTDTKVAYGVQFEKKGRIYHVSANKEVILSAGSIASPQILMLSGVGPAAHLQSLGIDVIADLPVGENLQDHVALGGMVFQVNETVSVVQQRVLNVTTMIDYIVSGGTALSMLGGVEALAWVKTKYADPNDDWPDIQFHFAGASVVSDGGRTVRKVHGIRDDVWDEYYKPIANTDTFSIMPVGLRPNSRGCIRLNSTNPYDKPIINPNYYDHPDDIKVMIEGAKIALAIGNSQAFERYGTKLYGKSFPGCQHHPLGSDDYFGCWIKSYSMTLAHVTGTCKMGPDSDPEAVVNAHLKVRGIRGLRVVDCSIMPLVPSGNTNSIAVSLISYIITHNNNTKKIVLFFSPDNGGREGV